jgi:hypothetical protein
MSDPAGWYPDPADPSIMSYWDGAGWTSDSPQEEPESPAVSEPLEKSAASEISEHRKATTMSTFGDGTWLVSSDIEPGVYRSGSEGSRPVFWERLSSVRGDAASKIAHYAGPGPTLVEIAESDFAFFSRNSGGWARVPGPTASMIEFACDVCGTMQAIPVGTRRHVCTGCGAAFRWQSCSSCRAGTFRIHETDAAWVCPKCQSTTKSYWATNVPTFTELRCIKCSTQVKFPTGAQKFTCPSCKRFYTKCPGCGIYVTDLVNRRSKRITCAKCRTTFIR